MASLVSYRLEDLCGVQDAGLRAYQAEHLLRVLEFRV